MPMSPSPNCSVSDSLPLLVGSDSPVLVAVVELLPPPPHAARNAASDVPPPTAMNFRRDTESMVRLLWLRFLPISSEVCDAPDHKSTNVNTEAVNCDLRRATCRRTSRAPRRPQRR